MTFLQPYLLFALPLIALPILIHLINQNRHKTIHWAATMFLLQAKRMSKGIARLRYILIMLMRMLAIAGLIFAVSRPMAGGWLGLTSGSTPDTTIIVLDRSASMQEQGPGSTQSKRETALNKLSELITNTGRNTQLVLFESTSSEPRLIDSAADLLELPETGPTATAADIPTLMEQVTEYIVTNETGRTDVWICSDLRLADWNPSGGRWQTIRSQLSDREGTRLYLLNYPSVAQNNLGIRVSGVHRRETGSGAELVMDIRVFSNEPIDGPQLVPVSIVLDGARSVLELEMTGTEVVRNGHVIPVSSESKSGWGRAELPGDANPADNIFRFVYSEPAVQRAAIISDDPEFSELMEIIIANGVDNTLTYEAEVFPTSAAATLPWEKTGLIIWQGALPDKVLSNQLQNFLSSGRTVIFFPPETPTEERFQGVSWQAWQDQRQAPISPQRWRTDAGLLANSQSGTPLPVGQLEIAQYCAIEAEEFTLLAQFENQIPLLLRTAVGQGSAYFCTTLPTPTHSNLSTNGIALYVMLHRALARGAGALSSAQQHAAGQISSEFAADWKPLDELSGEQLLSQRANNPGLYVDENKIVHALNRPETEDAAAIVDDESLAAALSGLNYTRIQDEAGSAMALASEIWRTFLIIMIAALLLEAILCIPEKQDVPRASPVVASNIG